MIITTKPLENTKTKSSEKNNGEIKYRVPDWLTLLREHISIKHFIMQQ